MNDLLQQIQTRLSELPDGADCRITIKQKGPPTVIISYYVKRQEYGLEATVDGDIRTDVDAIIKVLLHDVTARAAEKEKP